ncbi:unnamed protein product [Haemonchus placei]|uniref:Mitochondrial pyruvate carrier n=1 Tax=Haemonchus placei TaxID=6290 RepID=A0A0N4VY04_HAEPC|nr:unnamed protein product [Haemonchus placei]
MVILPRALARFCQGSAHIARMKVPRRWYAAAVGAKVVPGKIDKSVIEEDAEKLCKYVCINYFIQGLALLILSSRAGVAQA